MANQLISILVEFYLEIEKGIRTFLNLYILPPRKGCFPNIFKITGMERRAKQSMSNETSIIGPQLSPVPHFGDKE